MLSGNFHLAYSSSAPQEYPKEITWDDVKKCATGRWLSVDEIEFTLTQKEELSIPIHKSRPTSPPPTGTLLLYDRSITRNYKDDGIVWVKKRESKKVREDHVKLRINGNYRVGGCYVHSQINSKFHRRAYHLLPNPEKPAVQILNGRGGIASLILVHYLDTEVASSILAIWSAGNGVGLAPLRPRVARNSGKGSRNVSKKNMPPEVPGVPATLSSAAVPPNSVPPSHGDKGGPCDDLTYAHPDQMAAMAMLQQNFLQQQQQQYSHYHHNPVQDSSISPPPLSYHDQQGHYLTESHATDGLDVFWNMVMEDEEGIDLSDNRSGDDSYLGNTSRCDKAGQNDPDNEFSAANSSHAESLGNDNGYADYDMKDIFTTQEVAEVNSPLNEVTKSVASVITDTGCEHNEQYGTVPATVPSSPLPNIIDFTPEEAAILSPPKLNNVKVVISVSSSINSDPTVGGSFPGGNGEWRPVVVFLLFGALPQQLVPSFEEVSIATLTRITPQTFKFQAPPRGCSGGSRRLLIGALRGIVDDMSEEDVTRVIGRAVSQKWHLSTERDNHNLPVFYNRNDLTMEEPPFFVPLSQISSTHFHFKSNVEVTQPAIESSFNAQGNSDVDLPGPAPPPAMASIATALTDYPNPPLGTVVHKKINDDAPSVPCLRKRGNWCQQTAAIVGEAVADERQILASIERASEWAEDSVVEEVDRHCKIRFVEKLTTVIAGNEGVGEGGPHQSNVQWSNSTFTSGSNADLDSANIMTGNGGNRKADSVSQSSGNEMSNGHSSCDGEKPKNGIGKAASAIEGENFMDDAQLQAMDDDALDNLLDSLLIRIVETLVDMSASDVELHDELNSVDRSGFTLLHYASLYNLQALVPVLLSRGAHTDITTVRGKLTPLHLSAGAGNSAITELLVRHGCAVNVLDSYGATPADHALRNGFADVYNFFQEKMGSDDKMKRLGGSITCNQDGSSFVNYNIPPPQSLDYNFSNDLQVQKKIQENGSKRGSNAPPLEADNRKHLMQIAFQNLNLKDKLAINMLIKKHRKGVGIKSVHSTKQAGSKRKSSKSVPIKEVIYESEQLSDDSVEKSTKNKIEEGGSRFSKITLENIENSQLSTSNEIFHDDSSEHDDGGVSSCISDSDRESLDVAMSLMNQGELDDLEKSSKEISSDMRKWMLRRNYQSLREASQYLHHSLKKGQMGNILSFNQMHNNTDHRPPPMQTEKSNNDGAPTNPERSSIISSKKSIKNFKSQVFSELVIRKNLSRRNGGDSSKKQNSQCD